MPNKLWEKHIYLELHHIWTIFKRDGTKHIFSTYVTGHLTSSTPKSKVTKPQTVFFFDTGKLVGFVCFLNFLPQLKWLNLFYLIFPKATKCEGQSSILALADYLAKLQARKMESHKNKVSGNLMLLMLPIKDHFCKDKLLSQQLITCQSLHSAQLVKLNKSRTTWKVTGS